MQAATWAVSYDDKEYACRFRREYNKKPPDQKTITAWKKDLLETGGPPTDTPHGVRFRFVATLLIQSLEADFKFYLSERIKEDNLDLNVCNNFRISRCRSSGR